LFCLLITALCASGQGKIFIKRGGGLLDRKEATLLYDQRIKHDIAGARKFVFRDVSTGSRRGWNYIRDYNAWLNKLIQVK
jgi:hypothetical protein